MAIEFFGGAGQRIFCGDVHDAIDDFSICSWVNKTADNLRMDMFSKESNAPATGWNLTILANNLAEFGAFNAGFPVVVSTQQILSGNWHHLIGVRDGTNGVYRIYVDGLLDGEVGLSLAPAANPVQLVIGGNASVTGRNMMGSIDEPRFYDRALTNADAASIYLGQGADRNVLGMRSRWKMSELSPGVAVPLFGGSVHDTGIAHADGTPEFAFPASNYVAGIIRHSSRAIGASIAG